EADGSESLWIGSVDGLHRYAHGSWSTFTPKNSPLPYLWVQAPPSIPAERGAALWAATPRGLARYEGGRWTVFQAHTAGEPRSPSAHLPSSTGLALEWTPRPGGGSVLWAATDRGLGRFQGEAWETVAVPCLSLPAILALRAESAPDGGGCLWSGAPSGLARLRLDSAGRPLGGRSPDGCQALTDKTAPAL